jgi:RNA polymerase sigma factor (sigma-70 family)
MAVISESGRESTDLRGADLVASEADIWFVREVLPLEAMLMQFLRRNWRDRSDIEDIRQEIYVRVYKAAREKIPQAAKAFVFTTARNHLINLARRENVVPIEAIADVEILNIETDNPSPDRSIVARQELRRLQDALDKLPKKHRQAIILGRIEGLMGKEIAARMGIAETTASQHLKLGLHALTDLFFRDSPDPKRRT